MFRGLNGVTSALGRVLQEKDGVSPGDRKKGKPIWQIMRSGCWCRTGGEGVDSKCTLSINFKELCKSRISTDTSWGLV